MTMALLRRVIGAVLRRARQAQGRTLRDVAESADVSLPYLSEVERGTKEASSEVLAAICRALGMSLPDLLDEARKELLRAPVVAPRAGARLITHRAVGGSKGTQVRVGLRSAARLRCVSFSEVYV
jgi:transcriptional regulator with XRE-family HTH domain